MKENLEKIENWLRNNANKIVELSLQNPATENEVKELEKTIGKELPADFKQLYLWHNGLNDDENFGSLFYGMDFYPINKIISEYLDKKENYSNLNIVLKNADKEIKTANIYNIDWIKFAFDGSHTHLYLDLTPTQCGQYGQIIFIDDEYEIGILVAGSTSHLIENFANDLEQELYHLNEDALEDEHHSLETDAKIDIVNWQMSEIWKR
ncbi:SMI1/KNR4 family protein [Epilithonimonas xixisoli]|uniref:Cell wall assembly regulator SMI1 n=1 Tax=Epilithonimonas xixisoli TaxID=1476462 RepID=A0A4V3H322_9FLAO|nr:SMI1/KNR4 family protein [Epilithonimonas xixisoli]TDX87301.1 cell wall assembly regulator SMI1 [Epilithonimonas xixisoli]